MSDAPAFDPNKPYEPVSSAAPAFDPSRPFEAIRPELSATDVAKGAVTNFPDSAVKFGKDLIHPVLHPIDTATSLKNVGQGVLEKTGIMSGQEHIPYADAVGQFFKDRYGGIENVKRTLATDPVGFAADLSAVLSGGGGLAARTGGTLGKVGEIAGTVGRTVDPLSAVSATARGVGKVGSELIGGIGTGTGGESVRAAARAGYEGGEAGRAFQENMRGAVPTSDVVADARNAVKTMRDQRGAAYREGMKGVGADSTVLDFARVDKGLQDAQAVKTYKGQNISPSTEKIAAELTDAVQGWKALDPKEFHTVEGLDALKQKIGDIRDKTDFGTPARAAAERVYQAVRGTIVQQMPAYAKVMKGYEEASTQIKEIERTLSLNPNANVDTALRKLQSVLRNNVNANYGRRGELADFLVKSGAPHLLESLAGQALNTWMPRGLNKIGMQVGMEMTLAALGHAAVGGVPGWLAAAAGLPAMSPRLVGEGAYYAGKAARYTPPLRPASQSGFQIGRETQ